MRTYFIGYDITNMYSHPVRLRWTEGGQPIYGEIPYNVRLSQYRSRHAILIGNLGKLFDFFALPCLLLGHCYINFELKH